MDNPPSSVIHFSFIYLLVSTASVIGYDDMPEAVSGRCAVQKDCPEHGIPEGRH
jgi:hypothetical protein